MSMTDVEILIHSLEQREANCWAMARSFIDNRDAHGVMDMGAELQSLERARKEIERLRHGKL